MSGGAALASIWRHPLKAIGREELSRVDLTPGRPLPFDRRWAVTHARSKPVDGWAPKANFLRGVSGPELMAATAELDEAGHRLTLRHPRAGALTLDPDTAGDATRLVDWLDPLWPEELPRPVAVARCDTGFTDVPEPWIAIGSVASHRAVEECLGRNLSVHRWRANLWIEGLEPWAEFNLVGRQFRIGDAVFEGRQRITRCKATMANPETGVRDADTLAALREWGHQDFGLYAEVVEGGPIATGDEVRT